MSKVHDHCGSFRVFFLAHFSPHDSANLDLSFEGGFTARARVAEPQKRKCVSQGDASGFFSGLRRLAITPTPRRTRTMARETVVLIS